MDINDPQLMRSIIMDHYQYPRNRRECHDHDCKSVHMNSESCIDDIMVYVKLDHDIIKDFKFLTKFSPKTTDWMSTSSTPLTEPKYTLGATIAICSWSSTLNVVLAVK